MTTNNDPKATEDLPEQQILIAKQLGFSIEEIKQFTVGEILTFADLAVPETEGEPISRAATQEDIDKLMR